MLVMRGSGLAPIFVPAVMRVEQAALLADELPELGARDLLHAAIMRRLGFQRVISADAGLDRLTEVERLDPMEIEAWRDGILN